MVSDFLESPEVAHIFSVLTPTNRLICRVALHTGLRIGDVIAMRTADLDTRMTVVEKKTGKKRRIGLPSDLVAEMRQQAGPVYVFSNRLNPERHRARQTVYKDFKRAARAFRIKVNATPHSLRKVYAVNLYRKSGDLGRVQRVLNHRKIETTMLYAMADFLRQDRGKRRASDGRTQGKRRA